MDIIQDVFYPRKDAATASATKWVESLSLSDSQLRVSRAKNNYLYITNINMFGAQTRHIG